MCASHVPLNRRNCCQNSGKSSKPASHEHSAPMALSSLEIHDATHDMLGGEPSALIHSTMRDAICGS